MDSAAALIGSRISLISKKDIRYEGTLFTIDPKDATVALQNVKSHGTEGRVPGEQVPPSDKIFEYVMFRGQDIKDLHVHETPVRESSADQIASQDPAIVSASEPAAMPAPAPIPAPAPQQPPAPPQAPPAPAPRAPPAPAPAPVPVRQQQQRRPPPPRRRPPSGAMPGMGNFLQSRRRPQGSEDHPADDDEGDFDFESSNAAFDKEKFVEDADAGDAGLAEEVAAKLTIRKYDKDSFFDELSCDALDGKHRLRAAEERQLNTETFGETGVYHHRYHYRGGGRGGRGRGGRGGYGGRGYRGGGRGGRGRGRGGYYNNQHQQF